MRFSLVHSRTVQLTECHAVVAARNVKESDSSALRLHHGDKHGILRSLDARAGLRILAKDIFNQRNSDNGCAFAQNRGRFHGRRRLKAEHSSAGCCKAEGSGVPSVHGAATIVGREARIFKTRLPYAGKFSGQSSATSAARTAASGVGTERMATAQLASTSATETKASFQSHEAVTENPQVYVDKKKGISDLSRSRRSLRVAVDVDEVLGSFLSTLNIFCAETYSARHEISEFNVYDFRKIWKCSQAEANHRVHEFFDSEHFTKGIPPIPGALEVLQRLSQQCDLVIVTSRQHVIREPTLEWVEKHYPGIFREVHFGNHFALEGEARPKSEMCKDLGADLLIDDNPRYAMECAEHGIQVLLFDWNLAYPWSKTEDGPEHSLITRVRDWHDVEVELRTYMTARR